MSKIDQAQHFTHPCHFLDFLTENEILPFESTTGQVLYQNAGKTTKKGAELELNAQLNSNFVIDYSLTMGGYKFENFSNGEIDYSKNNIAGIPNSFHHNDLNPLETPIVFLLS